MCVYTYLHLYLHFARPEIVRNLLGYVGNIMDRTDFFGMI